MPLKLPRRCSKSLKYNRIEKLDKHTEQIIKQVFELYLKQWEKAEVVEDRTVSIEEEGYTFFPWYPLEAAVFCHRWDMVETLSEKGCRWHDMSRMALLMKIKPDLCESVYSVEELLWYEVECYVNEQKKKGYGEENDFWKNVLCRFEKLSSGMDSSEQNIFFTAVMKGFWRNKMILDGLKQDIWLLCPTFCQYYADHVLRKKSVEELHTWFEDLSEIDIEGVIKFLKGYIKDQVNRGGIDYVIGFLKENIAEWLIVWIKKEWWVWKEEEWLIWIGEDGPNYYKEKRPWGNFSKTQQEFEAFLDLIHMYCKRIPDGDSEYRTILLRIWKIWKVKISDLKNEIMITSPLGFPAEIKAGVARVKSLEQWGDKTIQSKLTEADC